MLARGDSQEGLCTESTFLTENIMQLKEAGSSSVSSSNYRCRLSKFTSYSRGCSMFFIFFLELQ